MLQDHCIYSYLHYNLKCKTSLYSNKMDNKTIAGIFDEIANILEIKGENRFKILAYSKAARIIEELGQDLADIYKKNPADLEKLPGIGKDLAQKIAELINTGSCAYHKQLLKGFPMGLLAMLKIRTMGPKKVKLFYNQLGIDSLPKLRQAAEEGKLQNLPRMGKKSEEEILRALDEIEKYSSRMPLVEALNIAPAIVDYMKKCESVKRVEYAGSARRKKETVGDIDILATGSSADKIIKFFIDYQEVANVIAHGDTKSSVILNTGVQVDLRVVPEKSFGAAFHYFTGSKDHNVALRQRAIDMGMKVNEYGLFKGKKQVAGKTESELYKALGLVYIPPELRENHGEIEAAEKKQLPHLVEMEDIKGDLHLHTNASDGSHPLEKVFKAYKKAGFKYIAITDHSPSVRVAGGMDSDGFKKQWKEIEKHNDENFRVLKGTECDILADGSLDLPDSLLKEMDIVIASVHSRFGMDEKEMTERVIKAIKNPLVNILGHPSARLIGQREPIALSFKKVFETAAKNKVALEINSQPSRMDLQDIYCKTAKEMGCVFAINNDMHLLDEMDNLQLGVSIARRGWLGKRDIVNTWSVEKLLEFFA
ncbi:DNA polymerase/3'-5' exonuclease PolX [Candidatus Peregrinibacteria bacterium]|nr:DNA polymerase/3'-5' exonuclease PolX [Candidatus Peregrinibacteria bacterium]